MNYHNFILIFVAIALFLLPASLTGCGSDNEYVGLNQTIGPGNYTDFNASCSQNIR